jgi:phage replication initiation protein
MNDKNFIEELRQKREEYGVTQTRLAVACGISREYYNRIEKGKQPLNDELREIIEKQIERFNPQEPLFLLIDYFRVRFPTTDALAIIRDVLQLKSNYMLYEDYGKYGYVNKFLILDKHIIFYGNKQDFCSSDSVTNYFGPYTQHLMDHLHTQDCCPFKEDK